MESFMSHYRVSIQVCAPADPATKGGVEYAVRLAKDDILPAIRISWTPTRPSASSKQHARRLWTRSTPDRTVQPGLFLQKYCVKSKLNTSGHCLWTRIRVSSVNCGKCRRIRLSGGLDGKYDSGDRKASAVGTAAGVIFSCSRRASQ